MLTKALEDTIELPKKEFAQRILVRPLGFVCVLLMVAIILTTKPLYWITTLVWTVGWLLALYLFARNGWLPKTPDEKEFQDGKFCEEEEKIGAVKQPVNTYSNMGFIVAGLLIVLLAGLRPGSPTNPMADTGSLTPLFYGLAVIFLGPGSMFFHASGKMWAGWFDTISMVGWAGYSLSYTASLLLAQWFRWTQETQIGVSRLMAVVIIGGIGLMTLIRDLPNFRAAKPDGTPVEEAKGGLDEILWVAIIWLALELVSVLLMLFGNPPPFRRNLSWLIGALLAFGAAFVCWVPSNGRIDIVGIRRQWCKPNSWYQGHGFWHLFSAIGAFLIYLYFASQV